MWLLLLALVLMAYYWAKICQRPLHFPPGPPFWPVIGNLGTVGYQLMKVKCHHLVWEEWRKKYGDVLGVKCHHLVWEEWRKKYGDVLGVRLGHANVVVIFGKENIREVAGRPEFDGRPDGFFYTMRSFGKKSGIVFSDGPSWLMRRKVVLKYLRIFGFGSRMMEASILAEAKSLEQLLREQQGRPVQVNNLFDVAVINVLWGLLSGQRFELTDERLATLCRLMKRSFKVVDMSGGVLNYMPSLRHVVPGLVGYTELKSVLDSLHEFLAETIAEHKSTLNVNRARDVIDAFLIDMQKKNEDACSDEELQVVCLDLLQAGAETIANTLVFLMLYMVRHPDVQRRVQMEVDAVCDGDRWPVVDDRIRMPFTEAVTMEVLRISSVAPVGIVHVAKSTSRLGQYVIPKDSIVLLSLFSMHMDRYWKDPEVFRPERFLDASGLVVQDDWLMPFGAGKRRCIGEALARAELFLFFTTLMKNFNVVNPEGCPLPSTEPVNGVTLSAQPFTAVFRPRQ